MPELPEVETTKQSLAPLLGKRVLSVNAYRDNLRLPIAPLVAGDLVAATRRAKYLILSFKDHPQDLPIRYIVHLGMSGTLQQHPIGTPVRKHDHVIWQFDSVQLHYHDPRRFGLIVLHHTHAKSLLNHLGYEPLDDNFNAHTLFAHTQKSARAIKTLIMDQRVVVGVGNIYAAESLFLAKIHPATPARTLDFDKVALLCTHIKTVLASAIQAGGTTLKDFVVGQEQSGYFAQDLQIYGRHGKHCVHCGGLVENITISGRASAFCPICQPF